MKKHHKKLMRMIWRHCRNPATGAEIGVYRGATAPVVHKYWPNCHMTFVDTWREWESGTSYYDGHRMGRKTQEEWDAVYAEAVQTITNSGGPSTIIRKTSEVAAAEIPDRFLDFVFIDASHVYEDVKRDIELWLPKTRRLICGHDYAAQPDRKGDWGVTKAVHEIFGEKNILKYTGHLWGFVIK